MKTISILADGGFGNRLGSLIGGLLIAKDTNRRPVVYWPENNWCGCSFNDLYDSDLELKNENINQLFESNLNNKFMIHENQTNFNIIQNQFSPNIVAINAFKNLEDENFVYYNNQVPPNYKEDDVLNVLSSIKIRDNILNRVNTFCEANKIDHNTVGLHIRKTDHKSYINDDFFIKTVESNPSFNFFVCSDDEKIETYFKTFNNVTVIEKQNYADKLITDLKWDDDITDNEGRRFGFNVNRSKQSVIDAFVDMLILSRTNILPINNFSSFYKFSTIYKKIKL